jgi:hypothetical protein
MGVLSIVDSFASKAVQTQRRLTDGKRRRRVQRRLDPPDSTPDDEGAVSARDRGAGLNEGSVNQ